MNNYTINTHTMNPNAMVFVPQPPMRNAPRVGSSLKQCVSASQQPVPRINRPPSPIGTERHMIRNLNKKTGGTWIMSNGQLYCLRM